MEEEFWRRNHGGVLRHLETSGRHLGGIWEALGKLRELLEASWAPGASWRENVPKHICFFSDSGASDHFA